MQEFALSEADRQQLGLLGITEAQIRQQIEIFKSPSFYLSLNRPGTPGDGIHRISPEEGEKYLRLQQEAARAGRFLKVVPASGAATRMFQSLLQIYQSGPEKSEEISHKASQGDATAGNLLNCLEKIRSFAFFEDLQERLAQDGQALEALIEQGLFRRVLAYLLTERGLNYGSLPKGLLKFHRYPSGGRTAFEEHLVEAAHYVRDGHHRCRVHFTIAAEHEAGFVRLAQKVIPLYEKQYQVKYVISFSPQKPATDTVAVDLDNRPFRDRDGWLLFRPGGHGALLENLNDLKGDLVYIKNIDNVAPDHLKGPTFFWKKVLGGYLVEIQATLHAYVRGLEADRYKDNFNDIETFAREKLFLSFPSGYDLWPAVEKKNFLLKKLNRPIRVCGMVPNEGEPGGRPFWVAGQDGTLSLQIVEQAQVDLTSPEQKARWGASTHFNPVDLVCALRNQAGEPFDLRQYVDQQAVFISQKSKGGITIKALELPGLWNGSMADWLTVFVEVPLITFNPVKTLDDLLRPEHQPKP